jgi:hypothetical protein
LQPKTIYTLAVSNPLNPLAASNPFNTLATSNPQILTLQKTPNLSTTKIKHTFSMQTIHTKSSSNNCNPYNIKNKSSLSPQNIPMYFFPFCPQTLSITKCKPNQNECNLYFSTKHRNMFLPFPLPNAINKP